MTQRQLDRALLAGIGVLLLIILGLALSPAPTRLVGDISDPAARTSQTPQPNLTPSPGARDGGPTTNSEGAPDASADFQLPSVEESSAATPEAAPVREPEASPGTEADTLPPAQPEVPVERVGFAYATNSEGACGVPLTAWRYVAVSRDLLEAYPCGTAVTLTFADEIAGRSSVTAQVGDTMGADITDTVNVFVGPDEPALEYGVTRGTLAQ